MWNLFHVPDLTYFCSAGADTVIFARLKPGQDEVMQSCQDHLDVSRLSPSIFYPVLLFPPGENGISRCANNTRRFRSHASIHVGAIWAPCDEMRGGKWGPTSNLANRNRSTIFQMGVLLRAIAASSSRGLRCLTGEFAVFPSPNAALGAADNRGMELFMRGQRTRTLHYARTPRRFASIWRMSSFARWLSPS